MINKMDTIVNFKKSLKRTEVVKTEKKLLFPLVDSSYDNKEILQAIEILLSGQLTMGAKVREFEKEFANFLNVPYSMMTNSGSSANLQTRREKNI